MSHYSLHLIHKFLKEKEINQIYISIFIMTFAESMICIFVPIYFFTLGFSIPKIIFFYFLVSLFFVMLSVFGANVVSKIGVKHSILLSTPFHILYFIGLRFVPNLDILFYILPVLLSSKMILYNFGFHLNYIEHSDRNKRGKEVSFLGMLTTGATVLSPLIAGFIIGFFNFGVLFVLGSALLLAGALPLFFTKDSYEKVKIHTKTMYGYLLNKKNIPNMLSFAGYAIESIIGRVIWPIFLIILLLTTEKVGTIVTLSLALSILLFYYLGRYTDKHSKTRLIRIGTMLYFFGWIGRIFANTSFKVLLVDSYKNLSEKVLHIPWSAKSYDLAAKENYFMFIVAREIVFNLSRIIMWPCVALLFYIGFYPFIISFVVASSFTLLYAFMKG